MKKYLSIALLSFIPIVTFAQTPTQAISPNRSSLNTLLLMAQDFLDNAIWFLVSLGVIFIVWNAVQFIRHGASDDRTQYRTGILWGIFGLFLILSIWGLVEILSSTFNVQNSNGSSQAATQINQLIIPVPQR